ncbi:MAG: molybdopterin-dependent oxidoreductase [Ktedonobacterales bacterium]|nr:molybdopterin-dependent oxidoreductase [Ktedonobacterales bacterium]
MTSLSRRRLLRQGAVAVAILGGGALAWEAITGVFGGLLGLGARGRQYPLATQATPRRIVPPPQPTYGAWTPVRGQTPEVTATPDFYYVSKGLAGDPTIGVADWRLQIGGMVARPYTLTYSDLMALPATERYHTLECISNEVGGDLMSNALWRGVRLADLLNQAGIQAGASEFIFRARDGYSDSLHLSQALDPRSLVVYLINGEPLPRPHGFPARLLVPGLYGMKNGKWLTSLELGPGGYTGYWEQQGWSREARVKTTTRIDVPTDGDVLLSRPLTLAGVAYAGDRGIARVDVSVDAGRTWQPATLHRPLDDLTWVLWEFPWIPPAGTYVIAARAVDRDGYVQTPAPSPTLPDGASGYNAIQISVR